MEKTYNPHDIEQKWYQRWEQQGHFAPTGEEKPYCIMIPPPNVTGTLHMGHGFQYSLMDILIRHRRMLGQDTLWQVGTDHAGIATQMVVERNLLLDEGIKRHDIGREAFVKKVWEWRDQSGDTITRQMRRLGASVDWSRERFTMDPGLTDAVTEVFTRLYDEGLIYRGKRLVNWDPKFCTAISDLEVVSQEENVKLWHIRYNVKNTNDHVVIATTRPETLLADTAIAVNPKDPRYQHLIGKTATVPLCAREVPIIGDDYADPEFGTGCVKITPAHDFNDYEVGQRHDLPLINIFTAEAQLNDAVPVTYQGMDREHAREQIVKDLQTKKCLVDIKDYKTVIPRGDRSGVVIEPYLTDQWFVSMDALAKPAITAVEQGDIKFIPEGWTKTYFQWMHNIQDWCISRQLWWGHRIPAWYDKDNNVYVGRHEQEVREKYQLSDAVYLRQDEDVLDTWFSSALWPFSTLGWPQTTAELTKYYPTNLLVTGFDIIFYWVARMIVMGLKFLDKVPFHEVYVTGLIRDAQGNKMSKSKGNVLDPIDLIDGIDLEALITKRTAGLMQPRMAKQVEKNTRKDFPNGIPAFGTDALRFTFCALASTGRNIRFDLGRIEGYRNFCNKLWNATRYVLMNTEDKDNGFENTDIELTLADRFIISELQHTIINYEQHLKDYRFDLLAQTVYEFVWHQYCDWYLELVKPVLMGEHSDNVKRATRHTLIIVLETILRLLHPIMPFITEEIWQVVGPLAHKTGDTIMLQPFPQVNLNKIDKTITAEVDWLKQVIVGIRTIRAEMNIAPQQLLPLLMRHWSQQDQQWLTNNRETIEKLAKLDKIECVTADSDIPPAATALVGKLELLIPMAGIIDKTAEVARLQKEINKLKQDHQRSETKLSNPKFVDNAPEAIVAKERERLTQMQVTLEKLTSRLQQVENL